MITRIEAYRYRCFEKLELALDRFHIFVGPNGAGKTTLLDIPILLGEILASRSIEKAFLRPTETHPRPRADYGGDLIFRGEGKFFVLAVEAALPGEIVHSLLEKPVATGKGAKAVERLRQTPGQWLTRIRYEIQFELFNEALQIGQEYLLLLPDDESWKERAPSGLIGEWLEESGSPAVPIIQRGTDGKIVFTPEAEARGPRNEYSFPLTEPAFANVFADRTRYGASLWLRDLLTEGACAYQPSLTALRTAQPRTQKPQITRDAASLPWLAHALADAARPQTGDMTGTEVKPLEESRERAGLGSSDTNKPEVKPLPAFERWQNLVRLALPQLDRIEPVVRQDDRHAYLRLHYRNGSSVPACSVSDGTLYILALTILPYLAVTPAVLTQEEPENGIHPKGIELIVEALQSVHGSQVFVSTHSPLVLAQCKPAQIVCLRIAENGAAVAVRGDHDPALREWHGSVDLGTLLASGVLG